MNRKYKDTAYLIIAFLFILWCLGVPYYFLGPNSYWILPILFFVALTFYCLPEDEQNSEHNQEPPRQQNQDQVPEISAIAADVIHRPSLGRIIAPIDDMDWEDSPPVPEGCRTLSIKIDVKDEEAGSQCSISKQCGPAPQSNLLADFGDDEVCTLKETACTICLVEYEHGEEVQRNGFYSVEGTTCEHMFHRDCISTWIERSGKAECPCCRRPFQWEALAV